MSIEDQIREIHDVICKKKPAEDDLMEAAVSVVQIRYSDADWTELKNAISKLCDVLMAAGVQFNNPRIIQ